MITNNRDGAFAANTARGEGRELSIDDASDKRIVERKLEQARERITELERLISSTIPYLDVAEHSAEVFADEKQSDAATDIYERIRGIAQQARAIARHPDRSRVFPEPEAGKVRP